jgi:hypothetical protein
MVLAADEIRSLGEPERKKYLRQIGRATTELWAIREDVYSVRPDITRDFVTESKSDPIRFERLDELNQRARVAEKEADVVSARALYRELWRSSPYVWFRLLADAGLYRTSESKGSHTAAPDGFATR